MPHIERNGTLFNYRIEGPSKGPWVTLAHGLATDLSMWDELTAALTPNYRVLRYDARGHGGSGVSNGDYSWDLLVSDIKCILDHLGIDKTHFVVLSMGGMIGLGLALDHPLRLKSLAACDARAVATPKYNEGWTERMRIVRTGGMETLVERTLKRWFTPAFLTRPSAALDKMRAMMSATSRDGYCGCAAALQTLDFQRRLGEIRLPTLYSGPRCAARGNSHHAHRTPGSHYVEIPDAHLGGGTTRPIPRGHLQFHRQCRGSKPVTDIVHNLSEGEWPWSTTIVCSG